MKPVPSALQAHLDAGTTTLSWCWRLTRRDGAVYGFTDHDRPIAFDGTTFEPESGFLAAEVRDAADLSVDAQAAEGVLRSDAITEADIAAGLWDAAGVEVWRVNWRDPKERVLLRKGALGEIRRGRSRFVAEVRSMAHQLGEPVGRTFGGTCDALLGDARCGVDLTDPAYRGSGVVAGTRGARVIEVTGIDAFPQRFFTLGALHWTSGPNAGLSADILAHEIEGAAVVLTIYDFPPEAVSPGDAFEVTAGCDKAWETCVAKFSNGDRFRGFPHVPSRDTLYRVGRKIDPNTGEPL